jgi:hypothetical protein
MGLIKGLQLETYQWVLAIVQVGGMLVAAGAFGYAAREGAKQAERNRQKLEQHDTTLTAHSGILQSHRELLSDIRTDLRRIEGRMYGENGPRP